LSSFQLRKFVFKLTDLEERKPKKEKDQIKSLEQSTRRFDLSSDVHQGLPGLGRGRLESLTDGIFGTVMTVLVLSLSVPIISARASSNPIATENAQLLASLRSLLPDILSYVISFAILGAFWMRHHMMFNFVKSVDRVLLWLNIIFLLTIGFIPFSTALIGRYPSLQLSLIIYGANLIATTLTSLFLWRYVIKNDLLSHDTLDEKIMNQINNRMSVGPVSYGIAIVVSFLDPTVTLAIYILTMLFFIVNTTTGFRSRRNEDAKRGFDH
jgi:uncharacterized membrane protein